jgi:hypothetical protein
MRKPVFEAKIIPKSLKSYNFLKAPVRLTFPKERLTEERMIDWEHLDKYSVEELMAKCRQLNLPLPDLGARQDLIDALVNYQRRLSFKGLARNIQARSIFLPASGSPDPRRRPSLSRERPKPISESPKPKGFSSSIVRSRPLAFQSGAFSRTDNPVSEPGKRRKTDAPSYTLANAVLIVVGIIIVLYVTVYFVNFD